MQTAFKGFPAARIMPTRLKQAGFGFRGNKTFPAAHFAMGTPDVMPPNMRPPMAMPPTPEPSVISSDPGPMPPVTPNRGFGFRRGGPLQLQRGTGRVPGPMRPVDQVPAMLTGGEGVINEPAMEQRGVKQFVEMANRRGLSLRRHGPRIPMEHYDRGTAGAGIEPLDIPPAAGGGAPYGIPLAGAPPVATGAPSVDVTGPIMPDYPQATATPIGSAPVEQTPSTDTSGGDWSLMNAPTGTVGPQPDANQMGGQGLFSGSSLDPAYLRSINWHPPTMGLNRFGKPGGGGGTAGGLPGGRPKYFERGGVVPLNLYKSRIGIR